MGDVDIVARRSDPCKKCGAHFELLYNRRTGEAAQFWPKRCGPDTDCFKRLMPKSDFCPHSRPVRSQSFPSI